MGGAGKNVGVAFGNKVINEELGVRNVRWSGLFFVTLRF